MNEERPTWVSVPLTVKFPTATFAYALSSARRKSMPAPLRLMDGNEEVVPPNWRRPKSLPALLKSVRTPSLANLNEPRPW